MDDQLKTTDPLIAELTQLRQRVAELETANAAFQRAEADSEATLHETRLRDITDRKRAEEALRESELLYQSLVEVSPLSICRKDLAGRFTFANRRFLEASNCSPADFIGRTDFSLHPPELAEKYRRDDQSVIDSGQAREFIEERAVLGGETTVIQSYKTPIYDGLGKITGIQVSFWDITARQRAETALRDAQQLHADLIDALPQSLYRIDRAGRVTFANRATLASLGVSLADCLGKSAYDFYPLELAAKYRADDQLILDTGEPFTTIEDHLLPSSGEHLYVEVIKVPIRSATGEITGIQGMFWDVTARVRAENALRESEARLRRAESVARFGNWEFRLAEDKVRASAGARLIYGLQGDAWSIAAAQSIPLPEYRPLLDAALTNLIEHGQPYDIEFRIRRPGDGQLRDIHSIAEYDAAQRVVFGVISDITERKQTERAERDQHELADSLREVAVLLNSTLDYSTVLDQILLSIGRVVPHTTANVMLIDEAAGMARVVRARGYGDQGFGLAEQVLRLSLPLTLRNLRTMNDTRQPSIMNDTRHSPDWVVTPETAWTRSYLGVPIVLRDRLLGFINLDSDQPNFFTDEHAQRLMAFAAQAAAAIENARLFEAERDARQLAESLRDTATALNSSLDPDSVLEQILVNVERVVPGDGADIMLVDDGHASVVRVRGRCRLDSIGAGHFDINATANLCIMRDTGEPLILDDTRLNPVWQVRPGDEWIASYAGAPIYIHGELLGFLGLYSAQPGYFSVHHTERLRAFADQIALAVHNAQLHTSIQRHAAELEERVRQRTRELSAANEQLTQLDQLKDQFISRISHELRTPLTNIKIYLELLETGKAEKRPKYMATLSAQTVRLQELIEDLLEVSQLDMAHATLSLRPFDLNHVATDLFNDKAPAARERDLTLTAELQSELPTAHGESSLTFQAAERLIANALAYTPRGGRVLLKTAWQHRADGEWVTLTVQDTGPGISDKDLPHLFERFYRGEAASDYTVPGTGLGLSISQTIIDKMNGRITVNSEPGGGAAFTIWLPTAK